MEIKKAGLILLLGVIISRLGGTIFKFVLIRSFDPLVYGKFALFLIFFNWMNLIATLNITIGLAKIVSEKRDKRYYITALIGCSILSIFISGFLYFFSQPLFQLFNLQDINIAKFLALVLPFSVIYNLTVFYFRGMYKMKSSVVSDTILTGSRIILLLIFLLLSYQYPEYLAFLFSFILIDFLFLVSGIVKINISITEVLEKFKKLLVYSFPIFLAESLRIFGMGIDRVFLGRYFTTAEVGIYDLGVTISLIYVWIATSYGTALLPITSKNQTNNKKLISSLGKSLKYVLSFYLIYTLAIFVLAKPVVSIINVNYLPLIGFLIPLSLGYIMVGIFSLLSFFVNSIHLQKYAVISSALFVSSMVVLSFYLIPSLKYLGAIAAIIISASISTLLLSILIWRKIR